MMMPSSPRVALLNVFTAGALLLGASSPILRAQNANSIEAQRLALDHKLKSIIIPRVEFHASTFSDAVEFLRQESQRLDTDPNSAARGINVMVKPPAPGTRITLSLTQIPLLEALRYVASQAGLQVREEPYVVTLAPATDPDGPLITKVFSVPPNFIPNTETAPVGTGALLDQPAAPAQ